MADQYQTPPASAIPSTEPSSETGTSESVSLKLQMSKLKATETTFVKQRSNDRSAIKIYIRNHLDKSDKMKMLTLSDKWDLLKYLWEKKITAREEAGQGSTRLAFPAEHDQEDEEEWLKRNYAWFLRAPFNNDDQDRDDEEDLTPMNSIKAESVDNELEDAETRSRTGKKTRSQAYKPTKSRKRSPSSDTELSEDEDEDEDGSEDDQDESEDEDAPKKANNAKRKVAESSVCSRALGIILGCDGSKAKKQRTEGSDKGLISKLGHPGKDPIRRSWQIRDLELVVWPPFEGEVVSGKPATTGA